MYADETKLIVTATVAAVLVALMVSGCGGGAGPAALGGGSVTGYIEHIVTGQGIGGMVVTIGGRQDTSTTPNGAFVVTGIAAGLQNVTVTATPLLIPAGPIPPVSVSANQAYAMPAPILVADRQYDPPPHP